MSRIIKDFDSFNEAPVNEEFSWKGVGDFFSGVLGFAGEGLRKTIKQKVAATLMEQLGVEENSNASAIVQEIVDQIPLQDYPDLLTGEKANVEYLAPMMAKSISEFVARKGMDPLAQSMGLKTDGWLYSTIREGLQSDKGRLIIQNALVEAFGGKSAKGSVARDAISNLDPRSKEELSDTVKGKIDQIYGKSGSTQSQSSGKSFGDYISTFWNALSGTQAKTS